MFPLSERNQFLVYMNMPDGTDISQTEVRAREIARWLGDKKINPEIASEILYVGDGGPRFYLTLTPVAPDPASAFFLVNTKDYEGAVRAADRAWKSSLCQSSRGAVQDQTAGDGSSGIGHRGGGNFRARRGPAACAQRTCAVSLLQAAPDVRDNDDDWGNKIVKVVIEIDQDRARQLGVTSEEVTQLLNTYFSGTAVSIYREGDNAIPIVLRAGAYTSQSLEGLTSATFAKNGGLISLAQVARLKPGFDLARIRRKNQERTITITARSTSLTAGKLLESIQPGLQALDLAGTYHRRYRRRDSEKRGDQPETRCGISRSRWP